MSLLEFIASIVSHISWPIAACIGLYFLMKYVPNLLGAIQYKHLAILTSIKDRVYDLREVFSYNKNENSYDYNRIYEHIKSNIHKYDLNSFKNDYIGIYPNLKSITLPNYSSKKFKQIKTAEDKANFVNDYITKLNAIILKIAENEYLKSKEDMIYLSSIISGLIKKF